MPLSPKPTQRLALFFDGTWNTPDNNTNVWRLNLMLADTGPDGVPQEKFYDPGVGTHWFDRISGGAFGAGLSQNVRLGYRWLMEHYNPGDEIYIFGFSRGAFTARSLAGVIARCGLLKPDAPMSFVQLYERYQKGDTVRPIYRLKYLHSRGETDFDFEEKLLLEYSYYQRNFIKMVGVWDTVGSIGVPFGDIPGISRRTLRFHNTNLSKIVQHSYQALALDEERQPYWAILWTNFIPTKPDAVTSPAGDLPVNVDSQKDCRGFPLSPSEGERAGVRGPFQPPKAGDPSLALSEGERAGVRGPVSVPSVPSCSKSDGPEGPQVDNRFVEQRWFTGAHCNVGGGYRNDLLPQRPLAWLQDKARACGLAFRSHAVVNDQDLRMPPCDSYAEFLGGLWKILTLGKRYVRWVMADPVKKEAHWKGTTRIEDGCVETVNERIDLSVFRRCQLDPAYRPPNLVEWAGRKGLDLEKIIAAPEKYAALYAPVTEPGIHPPVQITEPQTAPRKDTPSPDSLVVAK